MSNALYTEAGLKIQKIRDKKGYTRETLAEKAEISNKFLYEIETGRKGFSAEVLYNISKSLNVNCDYILTGKHIDGNYNKGILEVIELFDEEQTDMLIQLLELIYKFPG